MKYSIPAVLACLAAALIAGGPAAADNLYLVRDGRPEAVIVIPAKANRTVVFAASEMATYIRKASGVALEIIKESDYRPVSYKSVLVIGESRLAKESGVASDNLKPGGFSIRRTGNMLVIVGRDTASRTIRGGDGTFEPHPADPGHNQHGTLFGVYEFLERVVGVRWYWPGELGEVVPRRRDIPLPDLNVTDAPDFQFRYLYGYNLDGPDLKRADSALWWRRMRTGAAESEPATHSLGKYLEKYGQTHPEYFALQKDGTRFTGQRALELGGIPCLSNEEFKRIIIRDAVEFFRKYPDYRTFNVMPGDSFEGYCCRCRQCQARYRPDRGKSGCHSDIVWGYVNDIAREVGRVFPDRYISCCAYASYYDPPEGIKLEPNIAVTVCTADWNSQYEPFMYAWNKDEKEKISREIKAWGSRAGLLFTWEYPCFAVNHENIVVCPGLLKEYFSMLKAAGSQGSIIEFTPNGVTPKYGGDYAGWMKDNLNTYIMFRLMWDTDADVEKITREYCRDLFVPAAEPMLKFYKQLEKIWQSGNHGTKPYYGNWSNIWEKLYTADDLDQLVRCLDKAEKLAPEGLYRQRLARVREGFSVLERNR